jgi:hypothetical protein
MLAIRKLTCRKTRSALTVLGIAIGIAAVARGLRKQLDDVFSAGDAHLVLTRSGAPNPSRMARRATRRASQDKDLRQPAGWRIALLCEAVMPRSTPADRSFASAMAGGPNLRTMTAW